MPLHSCWWVPSCGGYRQIRLPRTVRVRLRIGRSPSQYIRLPAGTFLRNPVAVKNGTVTFVAGRLVGASSAPALVVLRDGLEIGVPTGAFTFREPQVVVDQSEVLHLLWAEPARADDPADAPKQSGLPLSIWHAEFADGRWSPAERAHVAVGEGQRLWWIPYAPAVAIDSANRLHVTVPGAGAGILHLSLHRGQWSVDAISGPAVRTALAAGPRGWLYLVYIGRAVGSKGRSEVVTLRRSQDGGRTWTTPQPVRGGTPAYGRVAAILDGTGALHVIFGVVKHDPLHPALLRQTASHDGGESWSRPRDLSIPTMRFTKWSAGLNACGTEEVIVYAWDPNPVEGPRGRLLLSRMNGWCWLFGWSRLRSIPAARILREAEFVRSAIGGLELLYSREIGPDDVGVPHYQLVRTDTKHQTDRIERIAAPPRPSCSQLERFMEGRYDLRHSLSALSPTTAYCPRGPARTQCCSWTQSAFLTG